MKYLACLILPTILLSCKNHQNDPAKKNSLATDKKYVQVKYTVEPDVATVGITSYTLITNNLEKDSSEARQLLKEKVILPLAMQKHDVNLFDSTLAVDFIYQGEEAFLNRAEYIQDRVNARWMISAVQYENLVLQFFNGYGVLTYRNKVKEKDEYGKDQLFTWFWTDIWIRENGRWKLKSLRAIN